MEPVQDTTDFKSKSAHHEASCVSVKWKEIWAEPIKRWPSLSESWAAVVWYDRVSGVTTLGPWSSKSRSPRSALFDDKLISALAQGPTMGAPELCARAEYQTISTRFLLLYLFFFLSVSRDWSLTRSWPAFTKDWALRPMKYKPMSNVFALLMGC